jgi:hypothetical protein
VELIWIKAAGAPSSENSAIDSIGFSVPDPDAKAKALVAAGATVKAKGVVVDPDAVTIELVEHTNCAWGKVPEGATHE